MTENQKQFPVLPPGARLAYWSERFDRYIFVKHFECRPSKLNPEKAREIRAAAALGHSYASLAKQYGVSRQAVRQIVLGTVYPEGGAA